MAKLQGHVLKEAISEDFSESRISILTNFIFEHTKFSNIGENINSLFAGFATFKFGHVKGFPSQELLMDRYDSLAITLTSQF